MTRRWCPGCVGFVGMGSANDRASVVTAEITAATFVAIAEDIGTVEMLLYTAHRYPHAQIGWNGAQDQNQNALWLTDELAGWLAYHILHHDALEPDDHDGVCHCGCAQDEHGNDDEHPNSTGCLNCGDDCIAYERAA